MRVIEINLSLQTESSTAALTAWETMSRAAAGFGFDGLRAELSIDRIDEDDDDDDDAEAEDVPRLFGGDS